MWKAHSAGLRTARGRCWDCSSGRRRSSCRGRVRSTHRTHRRRGAWKGRIRDTRASERRGSLGARRRWHRGRTDGQLEGAHQTSHPSWKQSRRRRLGSLSRPLRVVSVRAAQETVWTVAITGIEAEGPASHWASVSIRDPLAAAGVAVPLIQPLQSCWFRFESNSHKVLERTVVLWPETSIIRSAPRPSMRYPVAAEASMSTKIRTVSMVPGDGPPPARAEPATWTKKAYGPRLLTIPKRTTSMFGLRAAPGPIASVGWDVQSPN